LVTTPEDAVRTYLRWRADPDSVRPDTAELDARIEAEQDPLERVKLRSERGRLADLGPVLEAGFVANVRTWANDHAVTADALLEEGVERRLLVEAGILTGAPRVPRRTSPSGATRPSSRSTRVRREDVADHVRGREPGATFTTAAVSEATGGSTGTVRRVIDDLQGEGVIVEDGKDHSGQGRPRTLYRRV
jgi:hypothetical protein